MRTVCILMLMGCDLVSRPTLENTEHHNEDSSPDAPGITTDSLDTESAEENAPIDMDNDGYAVENDCNDEDPTIHPEAIEVCNIIDDDCDDQVDEGDVCPCPVAYYPDQSHPYMWCEQALSWTEASAYCGPYGYALVTVDSAEELAWITDTARDRESANYWWLGFTDQDEEDNWTWIDGSANTYINWCSNEPNNGHGHECYPESAEDCAMLNWGEGGCWNDYPCGCDWPFFICEGRSENRPEGGLDPTG